MTPSHRLLVGAWANPHGHGTVQLQTSNQLPFIHQFGISAISHPSFNDPPSTEQLLESNRRLGLLVAILHDDRRVEGDARVHAWSTPHRPRPRHDDRAGGNLERSLSLSTIATLPHQVEHHRAAGEDRPRRQHRALPYHRALV